MTKTHTEIAQEVLDRHSIRDDWRRTGAQVRQLMVEALELAAAEAPLPGSIVLTRSETLESDAVVVFDVDAFYQGYGEYDVEDREALVAGLREHGWDAVADDVEEFIKGKEEGK